MDIGNLYSNFIRNAGLSSVETDRWENAAKSTSVTNLATAQRAQIEKWRETRRESRSKLSATDMDGTQSSFSDTLRTYTGSRSLIGDLAEQAGSEMGVKADYFEQCMDQMGSAYGDIRDVMEEIYSVPDSEKNYYITYDSDGTRLSIPKQTASKSENSYADSKDQTYSGFLSAINRGSSRFFGRMLGSLCDWLGL